MLYIINMNGTNKNTPAKKPAKKKEIGLGRGLDSLLEDNSPALGSKPKVVVRNDAEETRATRESGDSLYRKDGAISYVKAPKWSGS